MEEEGRRLGVDQHLQLQQLLKILPEEIAARQLKLVLTPLFANSPREQSEFYELFDVCLQRLEARFADTPESSLAVAEKKWKNRIPFLILFLALLLAYPFLELSQRYIVKKEKIYTQSFPIEAGDTLQVCPSAETLTDFGTIVDISTCADEAPLSGASSMGAYRLDQAACLIYLAGTAGGQDTICLRIFDAKGHSARLIYHPFIEVVERPGLEKEQTPAPAPARVQQQFERQALPHPNDILTLAIPPQTNCQKLYDRYGVWLKIAFVLLVGLLLLRIVQWRGNRRRKLVAQMESRDLPPYLWNIRIDGLEDVIQDDSFELALNRIRQRTTASHFQIDIPQTVRATISKAGLADFRYVRQTRPPEYLMLIERKNERNHRAKLFDAYYQTFRDNEVFVERFFYETDVRLCWNENHPDGISIKDLQHRYHQSRLMIMGSANEFFSPLSGKLAKWTQIFNRWQERAFLVTTPLDAWGRKERNLQQLFYLAPASLNGLSLAIDQWEEEEKMDWQAIKEQIKDQASKHIQLRGSLIQTLRLHYSEAMLHWIAACALYPSLHWDLTLYLGQQLSPEDSTLLTTTNLMALNRLTWFVEGSMPTEVRAVLVDYLETEQPELHRFIQEKLYQLLQDNHPPEASVAFEEYRMYMALNEWAFSKDKARKKELEEEIAQLFEAGVEADFTVVKYLNRKQDPLDFIIPDQWKKYVYQGGFTALGWKKVAKEAFYWALPLWLLISAFAFLYNPMEPCGGRTATYAYQGNQLDLCLNSDEDEILYREYLARDAIEAGQYNSVDSLANEISSISANNPLLLIDSVAYNALQNLGVNFYNKGVTYYETLPDSAKADFDNNLLLRIQNTLNQRDTICDLFNRAAALDLRLSVMVIREASLWCENRSDEQLAKLQTLSQAAEEDSRQSNQPVNQIQSNIPRQKPPTLTPDSNNIQRIDPGRVETQIDTGSVISPKPQTELNLPDNKNNDPKLQEQKPQDEKQEAGKEETVKEEVAGTGNTSTDDSDSNKPKVYQTIKLENKTWLATNLSVNVPGSVCYNDSSETNCEQYGRLYTQPAAAKACASLGSGWRLPNDDDWQELIKFFHKEGLSFNIGGRIAYQKLGPGGESGFNAEFGGSRSLDKYNNLNSRGYYWTNSQYEGQAYSYYMFDFRTKKLTRDVVVLTRFFSCRCVKD